MTYDLDEVLISPRIFQTWLLSASRGMVEIQKKYLDLSPGEIPDEKFRLLPDGNGEIFVTVRTTSIRLKVPKDEFKIYET